MTIDQKTAESVAADLRIAYEHTLDDANGILIKKSYADNIKNATISLEKRIARGDFPVISMLRKKFNVA